MNRLIAFLFLFQSTVALAQEIKLPKEVTDQVGSFIKVYAETEGKVRWVPLDPGLNVFPTELLRDSRVAVVTSLKPGKYRLLAYTAKGNEPSPPAIVEIIITGNPVDPVVPPKPNPPAPNPTPTPVDPLVKTLQEAYQQERGDTKDGLRLKLIEVYRYGLDQIKDGGHQQLVGFYTAVATKRASLIKDSEFTQVRFAIQTELDKVLPKNPSLILDDGLKQKITQQFNRVVKALEKLE